MNHFNTLNEALEAEGLLHTWDHTYPPLQYGDVFGYTYDDGSKYGYYVSVTRFDNGMYERPIHYKR
jgi:hypothetical protein